MKKKTLAFLSVLVFTLFFSVSCCFANNNMAQDAVDGVRNFVGGAENAVEGAVSGVTNGIRNGVDATGNVAENMMGTTTNNNNNTNGALMSTNHGNNNGDNYTATRTATTRSINTATTGTFLGMGATAWSWFIMATLGIITVALVWFYGKQKEYSSNYDDNNY